MSANAPLRVRILLKTTELGGAERLILNSLPYLDRRRFDYGFAAHDEEGPVARALAAAALPFEKLPPTSRPARATRALRRWLRAEQADVLHAHLPVPGTLARIASRGLPTRVVYTEHTTQDVYRPASRWLNAASYRWQDAVVAVSDRVRASALREVGDRWGSRISVIPNGVDFAALEASARQAPNPRPIARRGAVTLLVPASLQRVKGHDVLLAALGELGEGVPFDVWLAGDGPERDAIERAARRLPANIRVSLLGHRSDVFGLMRIADLVVLPSRHEGLPLALLEAQALGRPVVASAVGGVPEVVTSGEDGWLVRGGDALALARALSLLANDPPLRERLGREAAARARRQHDIRDTVEALENLYCEVTGARIEAPQSPLRLVRPATPS
ncbi:MAG: glycosyltransferase [Myxococcota bacterium]